MAQRDSENTGWTDADDERDRRYAEKFQDQATAVAAALAAAKEAVAAALAAAEKAVAAALAAAEKASASERAAAERALVLAKAEADAAAMQLKEAFDTYRASTNEWNRTFREFREATAADTLPRLVIEARFEKVEGQIKTRFEKVEEQIRKLELGESGRIGGTDAAAASKKTAQWVIGLAIGVAVAILGMIATLIYFLVGRQ